MYILIHYWLICTYMMDACFLIRHNWPTNQQEQQNKIQVLEDHTSQPKWRALYTCVKNTLPKWTHAHLQHFLRQPPEFLLLHCTLMWTDPTQSHLRTGKLRYRHRSTPRLHTYVDHFVVYRISSSQGLWYANLASYNMNSWKKNIVHIFASQLCIP